MIHVVEVTSPGKANAWFAFDREDFSRKVSVAKAREGRVIFTVTSPRRLLEAAGLTPQSPEAGASHGPIFELAEKHGWDTDLYRADDLLGEGVYDPEPVSEFEACVATLAEGLHACRVYLSDESASRALYGDPFYQGREGFPAHMALREQLIALEVISDDL
ncbi:MULTISPECIES: hypothetical protein [Methylococcus]|uniref:Uncharacterized protein n=1 Tax=Methylococcus capsulatus TaxID=414 RepID=A0AA35XZN6_METCP|nr:hypothetical protein [Methylococcus capsulatus]QXP86252.1 hypothetical protein KW112_07345 [Methylococcus capsulatus]QXP94077.1 hypothetical protein KW113_02295 [Methylococcus capsulatus]UQN11186.1 hypothetical protein M3M30_09085 [Methylococcus capsulatus]CAI8776138.1 protein of unknown function [Methylococcus capsulatus]